MAALIGGSLPTLRCRWIKDDDDEKRAPCLFFQVIHPDAISSGLFGKKRSQSENVKAVIEDILGHGNESCMLPGQKESEAARLSDENGGLLFSEAELNAFNELANECGRSCWDLGSLKKVSA